MLIDFQRENEQRQALHGQWMSGGGNAGEILRVYFHPQPAPLAGIIFSYSLSKLTRSMTGADYVVAKHAGVCDWRWRQRYDPRQCRYSIPGCDGRRLRSVPCRTWVTAAALPRYPVEFRLASGVTGADEHQAISDRSASSAIGAILISISAVAGEGKPSVSLPFNVFCDSADDRCRFQPGDLRSWLNAKHRLTRAPATIFGEYRDTMRRNN